MVSMNQMAAYALELAGKPEMPIRHIPGPEGVRGRNSDNTKIKQLLGWAPSITLKEGLARTYGWLNAQINNEKAKGTDISVFATSKVVQASAPKEVTKK